MDNKDTETKGFKKYKRGERRAAVDSWQAPALESGIPIPAKRSWSSTWTELLCSAKTGDSFLTDRWKWQSVRTAARRRGIQVTARVLEDRHTVRVWVMREWRPK